MERHFNTAGPCEEGWHYMLPAEARLPEVAVPIRRGQYFLVHAPRQTGKTTFARSLVARLRGEGLLALWVALDPARVQPEIEGAELVVIDSIALAARALPEGVRPPPSTAATVYAVGSRLRLWLADWCAAVRPQRVVLLLDEADGMQPTPLLSLLTQLRAGYPDRVDGLFPFSVGLVGLRNLRDYVVEVRGGQTPGPTSPFNVLVSSFLLRNFTQAEIGALYAQHTAATGQGFTPAAVERAWFWTRGQPLLVNALAARCVQESDAGGAGSDAPWSGVPPIDAPHIDAPQIDAAAEHLVRTRVTHLDNLGERMREPRVARIVQAVLLGDQRDVVDPSTDDFVYVRDLGLLSEGPDGLGAANPMYAEVLTRQLTVAVQGTVPAPTWRWKRPDGTLDFPALVDAWRTWWRANADVLDLGWSAGYPEAVPHLVFLAFLQRVINGGGVVDREFASGRGRVDLAVRFGGQRFLVELKRVPPAKLSFERVFDEGVAQLRASLERLGEPEGWMIVFDQRPGRSWDDRMWARTLDVDGRRIHAFGG